MITGSEDGTIILWNLQLFKIIAHFNVNKNLKGAEKKIIGL